MTQCKLCTCAAAPATAVAVKKERSPIDVADVVFTDTGCYIKFYSVIIVIFTWYGRSRRRLRIRPRTVRILIHK